MYVLDTNTLTCFFKGEGRVVERLLSAPPREVAIPATVLFELEVSLAKSKSPTKRRRQLDDLTALVAIFPFDEKAARSAAQIRAQLEKEEKAIGPFDTLIAGTALAHGARLVTRNVGEFGRVKGLRVENWY